MKKLILILTLLFASQVMATKLTKLEKLEASLEFQKTQEATKVSTDLIKSLERQITIEKNARKLNLFLEDKRIVKHNKIINKKIDEVNKLDLNVNDLCKTYIKMYELEKNNRVVDLKRVKGTNSCFSRYEISGHKKDGKTMSENIKEIPFVTHEQLIEYFNWKIADKVQGLVSQLEEVK